MIEEIGAAAKWWANHLRTNHAPKVDNGARTEEQRYGEMLIGLVQMMAPTIAPELADAFELALVKKMMAEFKDNWDTSKPNWGSAFRCMGTDYHPDGFLEDAAKTAGINNLSRYLPIKTFMWINPGQVTVRLGYGGANEVIYPPKPD